MRFLRTQEGTDWPEHRSVGLRIAYALLSFLPRSNPNYEGRMHLIREWLVEFDDDGVPGREVGLDGNGAPIVAGPDARNYGFWLDTTVRWRDLTGAQVDGDEFERQWRLAAHLRHDE